jgi:hypothetical protein
MVKRSRITNGSTRQASAVMSFACAKATPVTLRPCPFQARAFVLVCGLTGRYTDDPADAQEVIQKEFRT